MWQCTTCGTEVDDSLEWCWICGTSPEGTEYAAILSAPDPGPPRRGIAKDIGNWLGGLPAAAGVSRRFSLGRLMLITTFFAVLFGLLASLDAPPIVFVVVAAFVTIVGLAQAVLFSGNRPREASVVAGSVVCALLSVGGFLVDFLAGGARLGGFDDLLLGAFALALTTAILAVVGGFFGYLAGCLTAGIFLGKRVDPPEAEDDHSETADPFST